jgi:hypothetical protein
MGTARESQKAMAICFKNKIYIKTVPFDRNGTKLKILIDDNGRIKKGEQIYPAKSKYDNQQNLIEIGAYDKVHELYNTIASSIDGQH